MSLSFNRLLDRWKHRNLSYAGSVELRDHLDRSSMSYADFKLTSTQVDTLNATPVTVIAAPGAGLINQVIGVAWFNDFNSVAFSAVALEVRYTDGSGVKCAGDLPSGTVDATADEYYYSLGAAGVPVANAAIVVNAASDISAGNGTIYGRIYYTTWKPSELS